MVELLAFGFVLLILAAGGAVADHWGDVVRIARRAFGR